MLPRKQGWDPAQVPRLSFTSCSLYSVPQDHPPFLPMSQNALTYLLPALHQPIRSPHQLCSAGTEVIHYEATEAGCSLCRLMYLPAWAQLTWGKVQHLRSCFIDHLQSCQAGAKHLRWPRAHSRLCALSHACIFYLQAGEYVQIHSKGNARLPEWS